MPAVREHPARYFVWETKTGRMPVNRRQGCPRSSL
jgi:hypothetical protein